MIISPDTLKVNYITSYIGDRVISVNEKVALISFDNPIAIDQALKNIDRVHFEICYKSIYNDHWIIKLDSAGKRLYPTKLYKIDPQELFQN